MTSPAVTQQGIVLGTAAYMSPEQARGRPVDKRADIWAFGAVLFEMLTGEPLFAGTSVSEILAAVIKDSPGLGRCRPNTFDAASVDRAVPQRDSRLRLRDIGEARITLATLGMDPAGVEMSSPAADAPPVRRRWPMMAMSAAIGAAALAIGWYIATVPESGTTAPRPLLTDMVPTPPDAFARRSSQRLFAFTPDARALIYTTTDGPARRIYRRDRNAAAGVTVAGTDGGFAPFVSPDGAWIGFLANGKLQRVPIGGGTPQVIHDLQSPTAPDAAATGWGTGTVAFGATWLPDDTIVYGRIAGGLWRVPASGGTPATLTKVNDGEVAHRHPHVLPGGRTLLFSVIRNLIVGAEASVEVLDLRSGRRRGWSRTPPMRVTQTASSSSRARALCIPCAWTHRPYRSQASRCGSARSCTLWVGTRPGSRAAWHSSTSRRTGRSRCSAAVRFRQWSPSWRGCVRVARPSHCRSNPQAISRRVCPLTDRASS